VRALDELLVVPDQVVVELDSSGLLLLLDDGSDLQEELTDL